MRIAIAVVAASIFLAGCVNSFEKNYQPYVNTQSTPNLELLPEGANPAVRKSTDIKQDLADAKAKGYIVVGEASFNGELESVDNIVSQAKAVKATMVIFSETYTDTQAKTSTMYVPRTSTTTSSGKIRGSGGDANYKETSTTSETMAVPVVSNVRNFDQRAVFLVKSKGKTRD